MLAIDVEHSAWMRGVQKLCSGVSHQVPHILHEYIRIIQHRQVVSFPDVFDDKFVKGYLDGMISVWLLPIHVGIWVLLTSD